MIRRRWYFRLPLHGGLLRRNLPARLMAYLRKDSSIAATTTATPLNRRSTAWKRYWLCSALVGAAPASGWGSRYERIYSFSSFASTCFGTSSSWRPQLLLYKVCDLSLIFWQVSEFTVICFMMVTKRTVTVQINLEICFIRLLKWNVGPAPTSFRWIRSSTSRVRKELTDACFELREMTSYIQAKNVQPTSVQDPTMSTSLNLTSDCACQLTDSARNSVAKKILYAPKPMHIHIYEVNPLFKMAG